MMLMEFPAIPSMQSADEFEAEVAPLLVAPFKSKFGAVFLDELDHGWLEHSYIVDDWYSAGDVSVVGGRSGSGKTFYILHLVMSLIYGREFFGSSVDPGMVLYQAGEGQRGVKKRLRAWHKHFEIPYSRQSPFAFLQAPVDLYKDDSDVNALIEEAKGLSSLYPDSPLRMIVIDTLATASPGADENTVRDMGPVLARGSRLAAATGAHVLFAHHGDGKLRGSTSIYAAVGQVVLLTVDSQTDVKTALLDKQKDGERGLAVQFELMQIHLGEDRKGKPVTSCVCLPIGQKEAIRRSEEQKGWRLNDAEIVFMKALFEADRKYGQPVPSKMNLPTMVRSIVPYEHVKAAYVELSPNDQVANEGDDAELVTKRYREALKKRLQRTREALTRFGVINAGDGFVWWTGKALRAFPHTKAAPVEETPTMVDGEGAPPF